MSRSFTNVEVIEEADELNGGAWLSDGKCDDELTLDGRVGDELWNSMKIFKSINKSIFVQCKLQLRNY